MIKLSSKLPDVESDLCGLYAWDDWAVKHPSGVLPVVGLLVPSSINTDMDKNGQKTPTMRFSAIEVMSGTSLPRALSLIDKELPQLEDLVRWLHEVRTGKAPLL
jgi:hypothetical protein